MIRIDQFLTNKLLRQLIEEVAHARLLNNNQLIIAATGVVEKIRQVVALAVGKDLVFLKAFLFLLTTTTYSGVQAEDGEGWHNDASCNEVSGQCFNVWIPLYCSDPASGIRVASTSDNNWLYSKLPAKGARLDFITRNRKPSLFGVGPDDVMVIDSKNNAGFAFALSNLVFRDVQRVSPGDVVIFDQSDLHQGLHKRGIRIQLTLKFVDAKASVSTVNLLEHDENLSKHGLLERQLIEELLALQLNSICMQGATLPSGPLSFV